MYYILQWVSYIILSSVALSIMGLSLLSALNTQHYFVMFLKVMIFILVGYQILYEGHQLVDLKSEIEDNNPKLKKNAIVFFSVVLGCLFTFVIANQLNLNSVFVAGLVGVVASILFKKYQVPIYCGSFAGMASSLIFNDISLIFISALFTGFLFVAAQEVFNGFGGKLGAMAFFGTFLTALISNSYQNTYLQIKIFIEVEIIICFILGAVLTNQLHLITKKSTVFTSGILGVLAGIILPVVSKDYGLILSAALFSGAFLGMTQKDRFEKIIYFFIASIFGGIIFIYSQPYFNGLGGKLGAIAFISSIAMASLKHFILVIKKNVVLSQNKNDNA